MDNEALVDQIVRSLSFEVVAAPQNIIPVDSTSKSTPLNVKIKVRKKQGAGLRHGVISMPQVDTRSNNGKHHDRIRLVSSDQTIMNFDVLMEAEFEKVKSKRKHDMISPDLKAKNLNLPVTGNESQLHSSSIFPKRNRDIFGKCKPGGCLDPPYGEEKYPYQQTHQKVLPPVKDDSTKLKSSSIFKNNIFKKKKLSSQDELQLNKTDSGNKPETDLNMDLSETGSLHTTKQYSNPIITYPHPSDLKELLKEEEKKLSREEEKSNKIRNSNDDKSKTSSIDEGSYYIIPKKSKKLSNSQDQQQNLGTKHDEINHSICKVEPMRDNDNKESKLTTQATFIPIPLVVPLNVFTKNKTDDTKDREMMEPTVEQSSKNTLHKDIKIDNLDDNVDHVTDNQNISCDAISGNTKTSGPTENPNKLDTSKKESYPQILIQSVSSFKNKEETLKDLTAFQKASIEEFNNTQSDLSTANNNIILDESDINNTKNNISYIDVASEFQIDPKSRPLMAQAREKSIIGITIHSPNKTPEENNIQQLPEQKNNLNIPFSSENLNKIWENENEPLKSTADVIFKDAVPLIQGNPLNISQENSIKSNKPYLSYEKNNEILQREDYVSSKENQYINETQSATDSKVNSNTDLLDGTETKFNNVSSNAECIANYDCKLQCDDSDINNKEKTTSQKSLFIKENRDDVPETQGGHQERILENFSQLHGQHGNILPETESNSKEFRIGEVESINEPSKISTLEDDTVTIEDLVDLKKVRSVSDLSIIGSLQEEKSQNQELYLFYDTDKQTSELTKQLKNTENNGHIAFNLNELSSSNHQEVLDKMTDSSQPASIIRKTFWKMDIALQSYIDKNNERIIKTFDSKHIQQRQPNDSFLVAQCYLGSDLNEIKIPIDRDNDLIIKLSPHAISQNQAISNSRHDFVDVSNDSTRKRSIKINESVSENVILGDNTDYNDANKSETGKYNNETMTENTRCALNRIYEEELVPLQDIIKGLREEIDSMVAYQMKFKDIVRKPAPKRSRPVKLVQQSRGCVCIRKL